MRHVLIATFIASSLIFAACSAEEDASDGGDGPSVTTGFSDAATAPAPTPDEATAAMLDIESACDLLGVADVEVAADGMGWGVVTEEQARCVYQDPDATHTVTITITTLSAYEGMSGESLGAGASGMIGVADGDTHAAVWAPAGADGAVVLTQNPSLLPADAMVALTESAAIAFENSVLPGGAGSAGAGAGDDNGANADAEVLTGGLAGVTVEGTIPATGNSIGITVTAQRVADEGAPAFTNIACVGGSDAQSGGAYAVLAMDGAATDGLRLAQLEVTEEVQGAGTYEATVEFLEADGDSFDLDGTMTIDEGLDSGNFDVKDRSGAQVVGTWECAFAG